jgi:very-short-patch-repair endonuclease
MAPERALHRLGGIAETRDLLGLTSRGHLRSAVRAGTVVRDHTGRYSLPGVDEALRRAAALSGILVEDSAARAHGWELKHQPKSPAIAVGRKRKIAADRRAGVRLRYLDVDRADVSRRVTVPGATVMHCAARMPFDEALVVADSALRHLDVTQEELIERAAGMPGRYAARCSRVAHRADRRAANPFESVLRAIALEVPDLEVEPQIWVDGIGRPDLLDRRRRLVIEADSFEFHGHRRALVADCERYNAFVLDGWTVVRFSWEHVMLQPHYVREVLRSFVGQPSGPALAPPVARRSA